MGSPELDLDATETARIVRAAISYAGVDLKDVERLAGINYDTLRNYTSKSRPTKAKLDVRLKIGRALGLPDDFMTGGMKGTTGAKPETELHALRARLRDHDLRIAALELADRRRYGEGGQRGQGSP